MLVVMAGGGSGGHLFPALAVAEELKKRDTAVEILFMGSEKGLESRVVPKEGYPIRYLRCEGFLGKSTARKALALWRLFTGVVKSRSIFRAKGPSVVVGTGGYVSAAPVVAAKTMSIPIVIMEQNLVPGLANRLLARLADFVAVTYHESISHFPVGKARLTGNPVRERVLRAEREDAIGLFDLEPERVTVLIFGGSSGARRINEALMSSLDALLDVRDEVQFLHQAGETDYERVRKMYREMGFKAMVSPFIHKMAEAYAAADVVVSRAGATTLAEITALGKAAILVPYPHAAGHQEFNARKLVEIGGARMILDRDLAGQGGTRLAAEIKAMVRSEGMRDELRRQSRALGRPDAVRKVADIIVNLASAGEKNV